MKTPRTTKSPGPARGRATPHRLVATVSVVATMVMTAGAARLAIAAPAAKAAACTSDNLLEGKAPVARDGIDGAPELVTDGMVAPEGTLWNASPGVKLTNDQSGLTYDLGRETELGAFVLQADANDTYDVLGSTDGSPGSFKVITQFENVVSKGHGFRLRAAQVPPARARFVRIGNPRGDGRFSVSEFGVFCKAARAFPPAMPVAKVEEPPAPPAEAPAAPAPQPAATPTPTPAPESGSSNLRIGLLIAVGVLVLLGARKLFGKGDATETGTEADTATETAAPTSDAAAAEPAGAEAGSAPSEPPAAKSE